MIFKEVIGHIKKDLLLIAKACAAFAIAFIIGVFASLLFGVSVGNILAVLFLALIFFIFCVFVRLIFFWLKLVRAKRNKAKQEKAAIKIAAEKAEKERLMRIRQEEEKKKQLEEEARRKEEIRLEEERKLEEQKKLEEKEKLEAEKRRKEEERRKKLFANPIFFDTETTGIDFEKDEILQLSIINKDGDVLFDHLIKPEHRRTWKRAEEVNGISPKMVRSEKTFKHYYNEIQDIFDDASVIVGYNTEFDINFLRNAGITYDRETIDVMLDYAVIAGDWSEYHQDFKWKKLVQCARHYGYRWKNSDAHNALNDTRATRHCFYEMLARDGDRSIEIRRQ